MKKIFTWFVFITAVTLPFFSSTAFAEKANVVTFDETKTQAGRIAFVKPGEEKIVEIDLKGNTIWEFKIPRKYSGGSKSYASGADIEWIAKTDTFLVALPSVGIIEVDRSGKVVWEYLTKDISHDVDLLDDGTLIFVNGWDGDKDYILTRINRKGDVLERFTAEQIGLNIADRRFNNDTPDGPRESYSNTHANAVQLLPNGSYLLSLRNYHRAVVIEKGKVANAYLQARAIHDPLDVGDKLFFVRMEGLEQHKLIMHEKETRKRSVVFQTPSLQWTPLRTVERLKNGNFLVSGSSVLAQITPTGDVVWQLDFPEFDHQVIGSKLPQNKNFIYKAAFVYK